MTVAIKKLLDSLLTCSQSDWRLTLLQKWEQLAGPLHKRVRFEKVEDDVLILGVYDVHWMQELYLLSRTICNQLNTALGGTYIRQIKFKLIEPHKITIKQSDPVTKDIAYQEHTLTAAESQALAAVKDEDLRKSLYLFYNRALGKNHVAKKR